MKTLLLLKIFLILSSICSAEWIRVNNFFFWISTFWLKPSADDNLMLIDGENSHWILLFLWHDWRHRLPHSPGNFFICVRFVLFYFGSGNCKGRNVALCLWSTLYHCHSVYVSITLSACLAINYRKHWSLYPDISSGSSRWRSLLFFFRLPS